MHTKGPGDLGYVPGASGGPEGTSQAADAAGDVCQQHLHGGIREDDDVSGQMGSDFQEGSGGDEPWQGRQTL